MVGRGLPFHCTTEADTNPEPLSVNVKAGDPARSAWVQGRDNRERIINHEATTAAALLAGVGVITAMRFDAGSGDVSGGDRGLQGWCWRRRWSPEVFRSIARWRREQSRAIDRQREGGWSPRLPNQD